MADLPKENQKKDFDFDEFIYKYRFPLSFILIGLILIAFGVFLVKKNKQDEFSGVEILESTTGRENDGLEVFVEIAGAVEKPGVYSLKNNARIEDLLIASGGISSSADREWMEKSLNRASKLVDGQKLYIPRIGEQSDVLSATDNGGYQNISTDFSNEGSGLININTATQKKLESLNGIGPVYAQNIIEHRPYSTTQELVSKGALKQYVFDKIKDKISIF